MDHLVTVLVAQGLLNTVRAEALDGGDVPGRVVGHTAGYLLPLAIDNKHHVVAVEVAMQLRTFDHARKKLAEQNDEDLPDEDLKSSVLENEEPTLPVFHLVIYLAAVPTEKQSWAWPIGGTSELSSLEDWPGFQR